ncbi:YopX family protein [Staphylococcus haemolyticus]|uniref:YopX family protein n=1 Tax=Staphylococcus haemolyticus TaxID=1283 RepID=UPI000D1F6CFF|nr:YopX family protein [Staphylococcus haemolyticus]PTL14766.1 hypothetical protein BUZ30_06295 [Staphylococcus haemolyticus]
MIKFRVWDKENERMLVPGEDSDFITLEIDENGINVYDMQHPSAEKGYDLAHLDCDLLMSTGLKDKNGVEIYEGDVVALKYPYDKRIKTKGSIVWDRYKSCFGISMKEITERYELYRITAGNYLTVIGNKYQHPELLEDE